MKLFKYNPLGNSYNRYFFIGASLLQAILVIVLQAILYVVLNKDNERLKEASNSRNTSSATAESNKASDSVTTLLTYMLIFMFSQVFQVIFIIDSVIFKNTLQIISILVFNFMTFVYSIFQYFQFKSYIINYPYYFSDKQFAINLYIGLISGFIGLFEIILAFFAYRLFQEFGWDIYKVLGADLTMRRRLIYYHTFLMTIKFGIFFTIGYITQLLVLVSGDFDVEYYLTIAAIPIGLVILYLGVLGVRQETRTLLGVTLFGLFLSLIYFSYKVVNFWLKAKYTDYRNFLTLFAVLALLDLLGALIFGTLCFQNFGNGLKKYISDSTLKENESKVNVAINLADD